MVTNQLTQNAQRIKQKTKMKQKTNVNDIYSIGNFTIAERKGTELVNVEN